MPIFNNVVWNNVNPNGAPRTVNGTAVIIDLSAPVDHIDPLYKIILDNNNHVDLAACIAYNLAMAADNPADAPAGDLDDAVLESAAALIGVNIIRHQTHEVMANVGVVPRVRGSDVIRVNALDTILHGNLGYYIEQAARVWGYLGSASEAMDAITSDRAFAMRCLFANSLHRHSEERHNWFTTKASILGTSTNKYLAVGGSMRDEFATFMAAHGHDFWHYLDDPSLYRFTYVLAGVAVEQDVNTAPGGYGVDDEGDPIVPTFERDDRGVMNCLAQGMVVQNLTINGVVHNGERLEELIDAGQAAKDRWPPGTMGISALITGTNMAVAMFDNICATVSIAEQSEYVNSLSELADAIKDEDLSRAQVLELKAGLEELIIVAYGYCVGMPELESKARGFASLVNFAKRNVVVEARGATLARRIREATIDPNAVENLIKSVFGMAKSTIARVTGDDTMGGTDIAGIDEPDEVAAVSMYRNTEQIANERARREAARTL